MVRALTAEQDFIDEIEVTSKGLNSFKMVRIMFESERAQGRSIKILEGLAMKFEIDN